MLLSRGDRRRRRERGGALEDEVEDGEVGGSRGEAEALDDDDFGVFGRRGRGHRRRRRWRGRGRGPRTVGGGRWAGGEEIEVESLGIGKRLQEWLKGDPSMCSSAFYVHMGFSPLNDTYMWF